MTDTNDATDVYRNDPTSTFDAHLFEAIEVDEAGGDPGNGRSDNPVASLCQRTTSYGPFVDLDLGAGDERLVDLIDDKGGDLDASELLGESLDLCGSCADSLRRRITEDDGGVEA